MKAVLPTAVGVPDSTPVELFNARPAGSDPVVTAHDEPEEICCAAAKVCEYATPRTALAGADDDTVTELAVHCAVNVTFAVDIVYVAPTATLFVPSFQPAKVNPVRERPVPAATVNVSPKFTALCVGTVPDPAPAEYVTLYETTVHRAVNVTGAAGIVYVAPRATLLVPSFQPAKVKPVRERPVPAATVNVSPAARALCSGTVPDPAPAE